jgi:hypothetical protein
MKKLLISFLCFCTFQTAFADSPLTYTDFYPAYLDIPLVREASLSKGSITKEMLVYLESNNNPLDVKLAIINALGWNHKGIKNSAVFFNYVMDKKQYNTELGSDFTTFKWQASKDELVCYAYLRALDNYFNINDAFAIAVEALKKHPKDFTVNMIYNLIKAQGLTSVEENCYASRLFLSLKDNTTLQMDMRKESMSYIFAYMLDIGKNCNTN